MVPTVWSLAGKANSWPYPRSIDLGSLELDPETCISIPVVILMALNLENHCIRVWDQFYRVTRRGLRNSLTWAEGQ